MSILFECDRCWLRFSTSKKACPKCGQRVLPLRRRFVIEVRDLNGKKVYQSLGNVTPDEARNAEAKLKIESRNIKPVTQTWEMVARSYIDRLKSMDRIYCSDVERHLWAMVEYFGKDAGVVDITVKLIDSFRGYLLGKGLAKATVDRYFASGRAAWNYSVDSPNPFKRAGMLNPDNSITRYLLDEEREALLNACKIVSSEIYQIVFVALGTGLRKTEILRLSRSEVDFEHQSITLTTKGQKKRTLYPSDSVMQILKDIPHNGTDWFWVGRDETPHDKDWRRPFKRAKRLAGIDPNFRFHDLRHDAGTRAYEATGDLRVAQELLGHSNSSVTMRYAHLRKSRLQKAFNTIDPNGKGIGKVP